MEALLQKIAGYKEELAAEVAGTADLVEAFRIKWLGTKGLVKAIMAEMKNVPVDQKKEFGQILNEFKILVETKFETLKENATGGAGAGAAAIDLSLPGDPIAVGTRHPLNLVRNQIVSIFKRLGFAVAEGPEIEDDWHNFGAMNLPEDHPARDMQDTFYINQDPAWLLRTHTSSVQARVMETQNHPSASFVQEGCTGMKPYRPAPTAFSPSGRPVYRRERELCRSKTDPLLFCTGDVWQRRKSAFPPKLFSLYRA